ncbi:geranylgeranyl diphosphate synthase type I [Nonomuraea thailandensis]|uniref:Geranylgeranyl diphosphate synthase type I n=1 Tax=Nonomuraea thailandensis TaxID=1188745 RepID=A0A9X2GBJ3_9ACTN|nr:polyprenyl synthetase family protein [Nonomuraea thailandensis]MCP2354650.1 geranylgeranyl diphosphate synthase type I [Nonomuraea thailandensis]
MDVGHRALTGPGDEAVARCRKLVEPALREAVAVLHPWGAAMAAFTLGWSGIDGKPRHHGAGKGLRPAIALLSAEAAGGTAEPALPAAAAVELVHAFSLVHDDIIDNDEQRRHREALWKAYGVGPALVTGDALLALAVRQLAGHPAAMRHLSAALVELVQGQTADMAFEQRAWAGPDRVSTEEYLEMAAGKTGGLLGAAAAAGVELGGAPQLAPRMWDMGRDLGVAFQIVDDILGIWGDPDVTGKPVHSDLRREKKTLPILAALSSGTTAARELSAVLMSGATDDDTVRYAAGLAEQAGGRDAAQALAERYLSSALHALDECLPDAAELRDLCRSLVDRVN